MISTTDNKTKNKLTGMSEHDWETAWEVGKTFVWENKWKDLQQTQMEEETSNGKI